MPHDVDALIAGLLAEPVAVAHLRQDAPHLAGLSTADAERVRAHLLASFEATGIPDDAVAVVAEELRTGVGPAVLAGAARAVRGARSGAADADWDPLLRDAATRIETTDVFVRWQARVVPPGWMRTARGEILAVLSERADRQAAAESQIRPERGAALALDATVLHRVRLEDQDAASLSLAEALAQHPTIVAFFYTRCMNPLKCSLTITRLGALARAMPGECGIVAISYDPDFDAPDRLRRYGAERDFPFGDRLRLVRATESWQDVRAMFGLRVGYGPVTVNEHARELFLVSGDPATARGLDSDAIAEPHLLPELAPERP